MQHGLTLWELMVTLLLVVSGVSGAASLQLYLAQQGRLASQSTQATLITLALSEQLRTTAAATTLCQNTVTAGLPAADMTITCTDNTSSDRTQTVMVGWPQPPAALHLTVRLSH